MKLVGPSFGTVEHGVYISQLETLGFLLWFIGLPTNSHTKQPQSSGHVERVFMALVLGKVAYTRCWSREGFFVFFFVFCIQGTYHRLGHFLEIRVQLLAISSSLFLQSFIVTQRLDLSDMLAYKSDYHTLRFFPSRGGVYLPTS